MTKQMHVMVHVIAMLRNLMNICYSVDVGESQHSLPAKTTQLSSAKSTSIISSSPTNWKALRTLSLFP